MPDHFYVYPAYLARGTSRSDGRRVPTADALADVTVEAIVAAAKSLGYTAEPEAGKQYPRQFYTYAGRAKVAKRAGVSKAKFLKEVAAELRRLSVTKGGG
jgi:signal recognition particle subunit SEC65